MSIKVSLFEISENWDPSYTGDNSLWNVKSMGFDVFRVEAPYYTEPAEIEEAIIRAVFNDKVRGEVEAWLSNE